MLGIFVTIAVIIIWILVIRHYRQVPAVIDFRRLHSDSSSEKVDWSGLGMLLATGDKERHFWDGFGRLGISKLGVHYKSLFLGKFLLLWSDVIIDDKPKWKGVLYGRCYRISSRKSDMVAMFVRRGIFQRLSQYAA